MKSTRKMIAGKMIAGLGLLLALLQMAGGARATTTATAAVTHTVNQPSVSLLGLWIPVNGQNCVQPYGNSELKENFTGNSLAIRAQCNGAWSLYIDGALVTPTNALPTITFGVYASTVVWTGSDAAHTLRIVASAQMELGCLTDTFIVSSGGTAAISNAGFLSYSLNNCGSTTDNSPYTDGNDSSPFVLLEGHFVKSVLNGVRGINTALAPNYALRLKSKGSKISLWSNTLGAKIMVSVDGVDRQTTYIPNININTFGEYVVADGLDSGDNAGNGGLHEYVIAVTQGSVHIQSVQVYNDTLTTALTPRPVWAFYGDSITQGNVQPLSGIANGLSSADEWISFAHGLSAANGRQDVNCGAAQTTVVDYTGHLISLSAPPTPTTTRAMSGTQRIAELPSNAEDVWVAGGFNDVGTIPNVTASVMTVADFQAAYLLMLNRILAQCPSAVLKIMSVWPSRVNGDVRYTAAAVAPYDAAIVAAISACNAPSRCSFVSVAKWYDSTVAGTTQTDGIHPVYGTYVNAIQPNLQMVSGMGFGLNPSPTLINAFITNTLVQTGLLSAVDAARLLGGIH